MALALPYNAGMRTLVLVLILVVAWLPAAAQDTTGQPERRLLPSPSKDDAAPIQHGAQPDPGAERVGTPDGDAPSAAAGRLVRDPAQRRILGLPVAAALVVAGVVVALLVVAGIVIPGARRRQRARGGGTYGR